MEKREVKASLTVIALLALTALALIFTVDVKVVGQPGITLGLPANAGAWSGRQVFYCHSKTCNWAGHRDPPAEPKCPRCGQPLHTATTMETDVLPADTEFAKFLYTKPGGGRIFVSVVLSGREREGIHRPQRCLVAQGYEITRSRTARIPMEGRGPLDVMVLETLRHERLPNTPPRDIPNSFAYWFVGQGRETPYHGVRMFWLAWDRLWRGIAHRWAYIVIQDLRGGSPAAFEADLKDFAPEFNRQIKR